MRVYSFICLIFSRNKKLENKQTGWIITHTHTFRAQRKEIPFSCVFIYLMEYNCIIFVCVFFKVMILNRFVRIYWWLRELFLHFIVIDWPSNTNTHEISPIFNKLTEIQTRIHLKNKNKKYMISFSLFVRNFLFIFRWK